MRLEHEPSRAQSRSAAHRLPHSHGEKRSLRAWDARCIVEPSPYAHRTGPSDPRKVGRIRFIPDGIERHKPQFRVGRRQFKGPRNLPCGLERIERAEHLLRHFYTGVERDEHDRPSHQGYYIAVLVVDGSRRKRHRQLDLHGIVILPSSPNGREGPGFGLHRGWGVVDANFRGRLQPAGNSHIEGEFRRRGKFEPQFSEFGLREVRRLNQLTGMPLYCQATSEGTNRFT